MLLGIRWGSMRTKIIVWSFVPTMIILVAVAITIFYAYQRIQRQARQERRSMRQVAEAILRQARD